eukprot:7073931-Ditylum_brightwellii.AAC.1
MDLLFLCLEECFNIVGAAVDGVDIDEALKAVCGVGTVDGTECENDVGIAGEEKEENCMKRKRNI